MVKYARQLLILLGVMTLTFSAYGARNQTQGLLKEYNRVTKPPNYDPKHNSAELFWKAVDAFEPSSEQNSVFANFQEMSYKKQKKLEEWFSDNKECIKILRKIANKRYYWKEYRSEDDRMDKLESEEISYLRKFHILSSLYAQSVAQNGNPEEAFAILLDIHKIGSQFQKPKSLINQLGGIAICQASIASTLQILQNVKVESQILIRHQNELRKLIKSRKVEISYSAGEKLYAMEVINRLFSDDGQGDGLLLPKQLTKEFENPFYPDISFIEARKIAYKHPSKKDTVNILEKYCEHMNIIRKKTPWALYHKGTDYISEAQRITQKAYTLKVSLADSLTGNVYRFNHIYKANVDACLSTLAILQYKSDKGDYPDKLDILRNDGYLEILPLDPYSNRSLVYRKTNSSFVLYSVGANFKDDGGKHVGWSSDEQGDYVFWPVQ